MLVPQLPGLIPYTSSVSQAEGATFFLAQTQTGKRLIILGQTADFEGIRDVSSGAMICGLTPANAAALRARLPWLRPVPLGTKTSAGFGDRLGLATPGHIQAMRGTLRPGSGQAGIAPIFAQQSVRENARTGRTPQQVLDEAAWGVFQAGWREPWGADADHLKTPADVAPFVAAGYTFFTIDPGDHVDNAAHTDDKTALVQKVAALPWDTLASSPEALYRGLLDQPIALEGFSLQFDEITLMRAAAKYGRAVAHAARMQAHIAGLMGGRSPSTGSGQVFDLEVSVDETETPTSVHEHFYIASELERLGVGWVSLAPRFVGRFEKGVDYIGSLDEFEAEMARHAAVARFFGGYKLSLHSGSDKFSIYAIAAKHTGGRVHLKTAGTSYLEALRVMSRVEPGFFREMLAFARSRYETDRATYHVSAQLAQVAAPEALADAALPALLDQFDARQVLHVTFGSVLDRFGDRIKAALTTHEAAYEATLAAHFEKHLRPFQKQIDESKNLQIGQT